MLAPLHSLWAMRFLSMFSSSLITPTIRPLLYDRVGITRVGLLQSASNALGMLTAMAVGRQSDTCGRAPVLLGSAGCTLIGFACFLLAYRSSNSSMLFAVAPCMGRVLQLVSQSVLSSVVQAAASDLDGKCAGTTSRREHRQSHERQVDIALVRSAVGFGVATGAAIGGKLSDQSIAAPLAAGFCCAIANLGVGLHLATSAVFPAIRVGSSDAARPFDRSVNSSWRALCDDVVKYSSVPILLSLQFLCGLAYHIFTSTWDVALRERLGYSAAQFSYMLSAVGWSFAFVNMFIVPRLVRFAPPIKLLRGSMLLAVIGRFLLGFADTTCVLLLGFGVLALGQGSVGSLLSALVAREAPHRAGYLLGIAEGMRGVAGVVGPVMSAHLYEKHGTRAPAMAGGVCQALAWAISVALLRERHRARETVVTQADKKND